MKLVREREQPVGFVLLFLREVALVWGELLLSWSDTCLSFVVYCSVVKG